MAADFADSAVASNSGAFARREHGQLVESWDAIDQAVEELAALAQSDVSPAQFYQSLLSSAVRVLGASGGIVWQGGNAPAAEPLALVDMVPRQAAGWSESAAECLPAALAAEQTLVVPAAGGAVANPYGVPLLVSAVRTHEPGVLFIELALPIDAAAEAQHRAARLLDVFCEVAADFDRRRELSFLRQAASDHRQFEQLVQRLHPSLDPLTTAYAIANEGRRWIDCDRLSVIQTARGGGRMLAVSGVDHPDRHAAEVRGLANLSAAVAVQGEPFVWHDGGEADGAPQVEAAVNEYLDLVPARRLVVVPMVRHGISEHQADQPPAVRAILVAESFDERLPIERLLQRTETIARHGGLALLAALAHHDIPFLPLQEKLGAVLQFARRRQVALSLGLAAVAVFVACLVFVPADFTVEAAGTLRPEVCRHLFAPEDAIVEQVLIAPGEAVARGTPVVQLRDPELEYETSRLAGELQTAQARLAAVQSRRATRAAASDSRADERQWAADEEQLKVHILGLQAQQELLNQQRAALRVASPIDAVLLTWNAEELLADRPVKQGQLLLTVANPASPWVLELNVPDTEAGHVLAAWQNGSQTPPVTFLLATDPAVTRSGRLERVASRTQAGDDNQLSVVATVRLEGPPPADARAGAGVIARIHCGRRSLGYVWLHDVIDAARRYWF